MDYTDGFVILNVINERNLPYLGSMILQVINKKSRVVYLSARSQWQISAVPDTNVPQIMFKCHRYHQNLDSIKFFMNLSVEHTQTNEKT